MVKTGEVLEEVFGQMKVVKGDVLSHVVEFVYIFDAQQCNPNGSLPENMPRQIPGTGQIYMTQESYKKRGKDLLMEVLESKGLYEEKPQGSVNDKVTLWVSGRAVDSKSRFLEIVGNGIVETVKMKAEKGKEPKDVEMIVPDEGIFKYFLSSAVDAVSFGAVVPVAGNINLTGPIQIFDAVSVHPVDIISEGGTGAFSTTDSSGASRGQRTIRQEYKVGYALMVGGGVFLPGHVKGKVFSSAPKEIEKIVEINGKKVGREEIRALKDRIEKIGEISLSEVFTPQHIETWIRAIWTGFATKYFTTSKNIRPIALVVLEYEGIYVKHFIHRRIYEALWRQLKDVRPGAFVDIASNVETVLKDVMSIDAKVYVNKDVWDMEGAEDGEDILLR